jgi:phosphatidate cytidylyltransferase
LGESQLPGGQGRSRPISGRLLGIRILAGAVLVPAVLGMAYAGGLGFALFAGLLAALGAYEFHRMASRAGWPSSRALGIAGSAVACVSFQFGGPDLPGLVLAGLLVVLVVERLARSSREQYLASLAVTFLGMAYCGWLLGFFIWLRNFASGDLEAGPRLVYFVLVLAWSYDSFAYLAGSLFGSHKIFPRISPSKTVEGTAAGLVASVAAAMVSRATFASFLGLADAVVLGLVVGAAAQAGDLAESMIKRSVGAKDSSSLIPGHGGFLDRTDSLLVAGPVFYLYVRAFLA